MNVLVLNNMAPYVWGGAEELAFHLVRNLRLSRVNAEVMRIPFSWNPAERLIDEIALCRMLRLFNVDRVIALKFPAYHVPHDQKVLWLLHQYRQAYDLRDAGQSNIPNSDRGREIRRLVQEADNATFSAAQCIFTNSAITASRLLRYNGFSSEVLMPPLNDPELFGEGEYGNYILASGRVNAGKRQHLLVAAMRYLPPPARLIVAGPPDSEADADLLTKAVCDADVGDRVELRLRFHSRDELASLVSNARAIAYVPFDEDSVGYVTMEAFHSAKAVITTTDSGGLLKIVIPGETGCVAEPKAEALAAAMAPLLYEPAEAERLGRGAKAYWKSLNINWPSTIERLLS